MTMKHKRDALDAISGMDVDLPLEPARGVPDYFTMRDQPVPDRGSIFGDVYDAPPDSEKQDDDDDDDEDPTDVYSGEYVGRLLTYIAKLEIMVLEGSVRRCDAPAVIEQLQYLAGLEKFTSYMVRDEEVTG